MPGRRALLGSRARERRPPDGRSWVCVRCLHRVCFWLCERRLPCGRGWLCRRCSASVRIWPRWLAGAGLSASFWLCERCSPCERSWPCERCSPCVCTLGPASDARLARGPGSASVARHACHACTLDARAGARACLAWGPPLALALLAPRALLALRGRLALGALPAARAVSALRACLPGALPWACGLVSAVCPAGALGLIRGSSMALRWGAGLGVPAVPPRTRVSLWVPLMLASRMRFAGVRAALGLLGLTVFGATLAMRGFLSRPPRLVLSLGAVAALCCCRSLRAACRNCDR